MKQRLLVVTSTYPRWQADSQPGFVHELCRRLAREFEVHVLCPHAPGSARRERLDGVEVHRYRHAPGSLEGLAGGGGILANLRQRPWQWLLVPGFLLAQCIAIARARSAVRPDIIHVHWIVPGGFALAVVRRLGLRLPPVLLTAHGGDLFALRGRWMAAVKRFSLRPATRVAVVSRAMLAPARALGVDRQRLGVLSMGVDYQRRFVPRAEPRRDPYALLFVGRLVEKKGLRHLLAALPSIRNQHPDVTLDIVGSGPEEDALRRQCTSLGIADATRFHGAVANEALPALYQGAALFVAPFCRARNGDEEGLGLVVVEAIGCGCPVLVSRLPALDDLLDGDADADFLVEPEDPAALARGIHALLEQPAEARRHALALRQRLAARFDWDAVAARHADTLRQLASADA